ncbi:MAG: DUF2971 domain-containing protein [Verrucomicrobiota bacterium]
MILWRYLSTEYACQAFETGEWKLGKISELNDPLDCRPVIFKSRRSRTPEAFDNVELDHLTESIGLLCYSEKIEDPSVWAHYGDDHRGIAFGFNFPEGYEPMKVKYVKRRARLYADDFQFESGDAAPRIAQLIGKGWLSKAPGWAFEAEHRHFISLMGDGAIYRRPHYFRRVPWEHLRHVVIGVRSPVTQIELGKLHFRIPGIEPGSILVTFAKAKVDPINRIDARLPKPITKP